MKTPKKLVPPHIGNLLKTYYKAHRINKAGLARAMNRSRSTVQDMKNGGACSAMCSGTHVLLWSTTFLPT